jgi:hypothetical protein
MVSKNALGEYLRSRRELIRPQDVGLPAGGRRKVAGLRREELAMLAGISSDYYLRLEQGRDQHSQRRYSTHLHASCTSTRTAPRTCTNSPPRSHATPKPRHPARRRIERVPAGIAQMIEQLPLPARRRQ